MNIKRLSAISLGHMAIDILNSSLIIILTSLIGQFNLTNSQIGLGVLIYTFAGSLTQPLFGALADRLQGRWIGPFGLLWTTCCYALIPFASSYAMLITLLAVGALGSAALHAVGMLIASDAGGSRPTTATSVFFLMGQIGLSVGPVMAGYVLLRSGVGGVPVLTVFALVAVVMMFAFLRAPVAYDELATAAAASEQRAANGGRLINWGVIGIFVLLILLRSTTLHTYMTFLPKYFESLGFSSVMYGSMVGIFVFGGALGTFFGGMLGDRFNRRLVIMSTLVISVPFCYFMLAGAENLVMATGGADTQFLQVAFGVGLPFLLVAASAGALLNASHSILIVMAQALLPQQKGAMGGATLGFMFASGAIMAWLAGMVADVVGLTAVLYALAFLPVVAGVTALLLPSTRKPTPTTIAAPSAAPTGD